MGLKNILGGGKPKTEELEGHIATLQESVGQLTRDHAAADSAATEAATDPEAYTAAAAKAADLGVRLSRDRERLGRLRKARDEAAAREKAAYVEELQSMLQEAEEDRPKVRAEVHQAREAAEGQHQAAMKELDKRVGAADAKVIEAKAALRRAQAGMTKRAAARIADLSDQIQKVRDRYGPDLASRATRAAKVFSDKSRAYDYADSPSEREEVKGKLRGEMKAAKADAETLAAQNAQMDAEIRPLAEEIERVLSTIPAAAR